MNKGKFKFFTAMILTVFASIFSAYSKETTFEVINVTPQNELPSSVKYPSIQIQFSEPVVELKALGTPLADCPEISIEPKLKGTYKWKGTSILSFESEEEVIPQRLYTIRVNKNLKSLKGNSIQGKLEYEFHTEDLKIVSIHPGYEQEKNSQYVNKNSVPLELAKDIAVTFNFPVNAGITREYISIKARKNEIEQPLSFLAEQEDKKTIRLKINQSIPEDSDIVITLSKGAKADKDCYPSQKETSKKFHSLVSFRITDMTEQTWYNEEYTNPVILHFSSCLRENSEEELSQFIQTSLGAKITKDNLKVNGYSLTIHGLPVTYGQKYSLYVKKELTDIYERKLDKDYSYDIEIPPAKSFVRFKNNGLQTLESQFSPIISFSHQNIKAPSYYTIEPLTDATGSMNKLRSKTIYIDPDKVPQNKVIAEKIDLRPYLEQVDNEYRGALRFTAHISYDYRYRDWKSREYKTSTSEVTNEQVLQVTDLALTIRYAYNKAAVLVSSIKTGKPVEGATVSAMLIPRSSDSVDFLVKKHNVISSSVTDANGLAELNFRQGQFDGQEYENTLFFEAKTNNDRIIYSPEAASVRPLYHRYAYSYPGNLSVASKKQMVAFIFTDRKLYKPGETLSYTVIDRNLKEGAYSPVPAEESSYTIKLSDYYGARNSIYGTSKGKLTKQGTCWGTFTLPNDIKPGSYNLTYSRNCNGVESSESISIDVQYFEKVRFEVNSNIEDNSYIYGDEVTASVSAKYLGGGSLSDSNYFARWNYSQASFHPTHKEYSEMSFGPLNRDSNKGSLDSSSGVLDSDGKASVSQVTNKIANKGFPVKYTMESQVTDSGNQAISTTSSVIVHPAQYYIGISKIKNIKGFAKKGETLKFDYACITPSEEVPSDMNYGKEKNITLELLRENWKRIQTLEPSGYVSVKYEKELVNEETRQIPLSSANRLSEITVSPKDSGAYLLRLSSKDSKENPVVTETYFYVTGSNWYYHNNNNSQEIKLTADKEEYSVGDTAHILMQSELPKGTYLVTIEREGILSERTVTLSEPSSVLDIKIEETYIPTVYVSVSSYSVRKNTDCAKSINEELPKSYYGATALNVNANLKSIDIQIKADKETYQSGDNAKITITATKNGVPVKNAAIALLAVDRGVLDLINYHIQNPLSFFYDKSRFSNHALGGDSRSLLIAQEQYEEVREEFDDCMVTMESVNGMRLLKSSAAPMMMKESKASGNNMAVRSNFEPTAIFEPNLITDKNGKVTCSVVWPDSLTSYRVTAIAINEDAFGLAEDKIDVCEPVSVRTVIPRLLRIDDKGELGVVISNLTSKSQNINVRLNVYEGIESSGKEQSPSDIQKLPGKAIVIDKKSDKKIKVNANKTSPLMFNIQAVKQGWVTLEFIVQGSSINERILMPLQIEKPYIFETVTTVGSTEDFANEKILIPQDAEDNRYNIYVQLDPTRLGVLREAVGYVFHYPYGCMEQRSAAVLPLVAFSDYIKVFGLDSEVMYPKGVAEQEIHSWAPIQKSDGGFPYWKDGKESNGYVSMRIAEIAYLAGQNNIPTGNINLRRLAEYLKKFSESEIKNSYSWSLYNAAYACYTASLLGANINDAIIESIAQNDNSDIETIELCALTYLLKNNVGQAQKLMQRILSFTRLTARGIDISQKYKNHCWCFFNDDSERYALLLQLYTKLNPKDNISQHIVYELLKMQRAHNGRWQSTAVTSRVLIALNEYIKANDLENLDFTAEVLLNGSRELSGSFKGITAQAVQADIVPKDKDIDLEFAKSGKGTLYYTASMKYAVPPSKQIARDEGLCIATEIVDVKTGRIVAENELIKGNVYREKVTVSSRIMAEYVAVRAPVPSGCEILNTAFVTTGTIANPPEEKNPSRRTYNRGLSYKGIYDAEVQFFWNYFPAGIQEVEFQFRAVRPGEYHTPCSTAECMYEEEIFGRTDGKIWTIK